MSPLLIIANCTATWLSALVRKRLLLYKDIEFQVFLPSIRRQLSRVIITLNLKHIKRSSRKSRK
jgi:hypothetical protein